MPRSRFIVRFSDTDFKLSDNILSIQEPLLLAILVQEAKIVLNPYDFNKERNSNLSNKLWLISAFQNINIKISCDVDIVYLVESVQNC